MKVKHFTVSHLILGSILLLFFTFNQPPVQAISQIKKETNMSQSDLSVDSDFNHLKKEKSPYLLQHADNPVHWYAWGDEAFAKAKKEDKPVFLSIGYSTCHWCHVMAHESFENEDIAEILNKYFVIDGKMENNSEY